MDDEIGLRGNQFNISLTLFFITYIVFEMCVIPQQHPFSVVFSRTAPLRYVRANGFSPLDQPIWPVIGSDREFG
jgi:hypothetical protein